MAVVLTFLGYSCHGVSEQWLQQACCDVDNRTEGLEVVPPPAALWLRAIAKLSRRKRLPRTSDAEAAKKQG